jgi:glycosyltransferase involved in cell wall biosynthesis
MKADGIGLAIAAMQLLNDPRLRLVIVGDGPSFGALQESAARANAALGRPAVVLTGSLTDPRPAYGAADIMLGMGGSALRSMAFGKPLIVLGVQGFAKPVRPATVDEFLVGSFFGVGSGDRDARPLAAWITELADQPALRSELGAFGHRLILQRFSLKAASASLEEVYAAAVGAVCPPVRRSWEAVRVAACRAGSEWLPERAKDLLLPVVRSVRSA